MAVAIRTITRLQDADDINVSLGAGVDEYGLCWDNDTAKFVLRAVSAGVTDHGALTGLADDDHTQYLLATGARTGASSAAQPFTVGISLTDTTTATTGVIFKGADRFLHNFHHPTGSTAVPDGKNTFVGVLAGNLTLGSTATSTYHGSENVGIGVEALNSLTTGYRNMAIGSRACYVVTTGNNNMALGYGALRSTTDGYSNVAIGSTAMWKNVSGMYNVAVGAGALFNSLGNHNVAIGNVAGQFQADGITDLRPNTSVYIGSAVRGFDNSDSNSIVIGYAAIGTGANTTVIGSNSTTAATLYGAGLFNLTNATTNALVPMLTLTKNVTGAGVGAAGLGPVIVFQAESSTTASVQQARIGALWNDATHASYKADLVGYASDAAGEREIWRGRGNGSAAAIGFLGATPAARIAHVADASTTHAITDPADAPADADALREDLVTNVIPSIESALNALGTTINSLLTTVETFGFHATS